MLQFSHLTKTYKKRNVVDDFSLTVDVPVFGFLGQNGAGKTTVMKMVVGLLRPTNGTIILDGKPSADEASRRRIGYMPETPYFYERMTGLEFMRFCDELDGSRGEGRGEGRGNGRGESRAMGLGEEREGKSGKRRDAEGDARKTHYETLLKKTGIYAARNAEVRTYSKGMRQRLGFAQALVNDPEYLFLDEPLDGLDPIGRREMKEVMLNLKKEGRKIFLNTHILYDVEEICGEMGVIHEGRLLYAGPVKAFTAGKPLEERFMETVESHETREAREAREAREEGTVQRPAVKR